MSSTVTRRATSQSQSDSPVLPTSSPDPLIESGDIRSTKFKRVLIVLAGLTAAPLILSVLVLYAIDYGSINNEIRTRIYKKQIYFTPASFRSDNTNKPSEAKSIIGIVTLISISLVIMLIAVIMFIIIRIKRSTTEFSFEAEHHFYKATKIGGYPEIGKGMAKDHYRHHIDSSIAPSTPHIAEQQCNPFNEILEMSFDENGLFYHSYKYGVTIIIPPGAVLKPCTLQFGACLVLPHFRSSDSFIPVSPFVWINIDTVLSKPAELYIPHYVDVSSDEDKMKLCLLTSEEDHSEEGEVFAFTVNIEAHVNILPSVARIRAFNFCSLCIAAKDPPCKRYYLLYAEKELGDGSLHVDICIMYSIRCLQKVEEQFKEYEESGMFRHGPVSLSDDSKGISITFDPIDVPGWQIGFRGIHCEQITEDMIDFYKVLGCTPETVKGGHIKDLQTHEEVKSYPPRFKLLFSPDGSHNENTQVKLHLHGLSNAFSITVRLGKERPGSSSPVSSTSSDTSGCSSVSRDGVSSTTSVPRNSLPTSSCGSDTFIIDLMNFLGLKLHSNWLEFGHHLNLPIEELYRIEEKVGQDGKRCIRHVLFLWRRLNLAASWEPIAEALKKSGLSLLSDIVTQRYTNPGPTFCQTCQCAHGVDFTDCNIHDILASSSNNSLLQSAPDISKLSDLVGAEIPAKWELFGVQVGLEQSYLDCLREHHNPKIRFIHLFNEWKTMKTSDFTWATVIKVLYSKTISEYTLAENILKKLKSSSIDLSQPLDHV